MTIENELDAVEVRVLGCLLEKSQTTPDQYPLSLAALTAAANQKSSRDPVMQLPESAVTTALERLIGLGLARERAHAGGRVPRYAHRLADSLGLSFGFGESEIALLALLMLRGAQTPGELRSRSARAHAFASVEEVEHCLRGLAAAERGPYVVELDREPGRRERRWAHCFGDSPPAGTDTIAPAAAAPAMPMPASRTTLEARIEALEARVAQLETVLAGAAGESTPSRD